MSTPESTVLRLESGAVEVWLTAMAAVGETLRPRYLQLLSPPELVRWRRFLVEGARDQYLIARALLRTTLSRYADVPESAWVFETNEYGCPFVAEPAAHRDLRFNLSHTDGLIACAVARQIEIGVDVENTDRSVDPIALAPAVFAATEVADVAALPDEQRQQRFFSYWTLKESYIKARGMGLSLPLDGFWFDLRDAEPRIQFTDRCPDHPERWYFVQRQPTPSHKLALAVAAAPSTPPEIRWRWVVPLKKE